jgi:hypothetical protein
MCLQGRGEATVTTTTSFLRVAKGGWLHHHLVKGTNEPPEKTNDSEPLAITEKNTIAHKKAGVHLFGHDGSFLSSRRTCDWPVWRTLGLAKPAMYLLD